MFSIPVSTPLKTFLFAKPIRVRPQLPLHSAYSRSFSRFCNVGICKAGIDVLHNIKPGGRVETDKLSSGLRNLTMDAVDEIGGRVTVGDVASRAGIVLHEAQKALQALAADSGGFLEVSNEGDILYVFPKDFRSKLSMKSLRIKFEPLIDKAQSAVAYIVRISFGIALIASVVLVFTTIMAILSSRSDDKKDRRRGTHRPGFTFAFDVTRLLWYLDPYYYRRRRKDNGNNFLESAFSFVFGDGDPNEGIEEERWKMIGRHISVSGGVIAAEEIAPFLDLETMEQTLNDESYILPVLLRFEGHPEVGDEGDIVYRFPMLQRTAAVPKNGKKYVGRWADWVGSMKTKYLEERKWELSKASESQKAMAVALGGLNLFGVLLLSNMLKSVTNPQTGFVSFVSDIMPLLQVYAVSFFVIPLIRLFVINRRNAGIERRNIVRKKCFKALEKPGAPLVRKIKRARSMASKCQVGDEHIVYTSDKDLSEQAYEFDDWDSRLEDIQRSAD